MALDDEAFERLWMQGLNSERPIGKPKDWNGIEAGFEEFQYKSKNYVGGFPGDVEMLLGAA